MKPLLDDELFEEAEELDAPEPGKDQAAAQLGRKGGAARAKSLSPEQRAEIAKKGASARWAKSPAPSEKE